MFGSQKNVFWEALLVTILLFGIGVFMGVILENWRVSEVNYLYQQSEIELLDIRVQDEIYSQGNFDCENAVQENLRFADRIYEEAKILGRYETAGRLTDKLKLEHKKYDVLRALLWVNSIRIKNKCDADFYNVVYIYKYNELDLDTKAKQSVFSNILSELKKKKSDKVVLIPFAGDNNLSSVNLLMNLYNITESELPIIFVNEKVKITELQNVEDIEKLIK